MPPQSKLVVAVVVDSVVFGNDDVEVVQVERKSGKTSTTSGIKKLNTSPNGWNDGLDRN